MLDFTSKNTLDALYTRMDFDLDLLKKTIKKMNENLPPNVATEFKDYLFSKIKADGFNKFSFEEVDDLISLKHLFPNHQAEILHELVENFECYMDNNGDLDKFKLAVLNFQEGRLELYDKYKHHYLDYWSLFWPLNKEDMELFFDLFPDKTDDIIEFCLKEYNGSYKEV